MACHLLDSPLTASSSSAERAAADELDAALAVRWAQPPPPLWRRVLVLGLAAGVPFAVVAAVGALVLLRVSDVDKGKLCRIERCRSVDISAVGEEGDCHKARCTACHDGFAPFYDDEGQYCGPQCPVGGGCEKVHAPPRDAKKCSELTSGVLCDRCSDGFQPLLHSKTLEPLGACTYVCTAAQLGAGCAPQSCRADGSCSGCAPGFDLVHGSGSPTAFLQRSDNFSYCEKATERVPMQFYMYRAQSQITYPPENSDLASAGGVMWYLHNEVVARNQSCTCMTPSCTSRHNDITRVLRYKVTVLNPEQAGHGQFGHFLQFDSGRCSYASCEDQWSNPSYVVGCQMTPKVGGVPVQSADYGSKSMWYSLPGPCPMLPFSDPNKTVCAEGGGSYPFEQPRPGGAWCDNQTHPPDGTNACTWSAEDAGEISLDELAGIIDHARFCKEGNYEYDDLSDQGQGTTFWDGKADPALNAQRVVRMLELFAKHYPEADNLLPEPICDGW
mmetsp:Transcript_2703/g.6910  ORF Transcript_2703/g.6910 Transcript_2703/m.6910 type:complete len:500 (+) Transcript_2703:125-1624(+)